jgi:hypothetical protein
MPVNIRRLTDEDHPVRFVSDRYPDSEFTFAQLLMIERIQEAGDFNFQDAWMILSEIGVGTVLSVDDLKLYLRIYADSEPDDA